MRIIFVTGNEKKLREIREIIDDFPIPVVSMREAGVYTEIEETGTSFRENALIKVRSLPLTEDAILMADDSGLSVDALGGAPGIYSSRWMGADTPYSEKNAELIRLLDGRKGEERAAHYTCAVAVRFPDGSEDVFEGIMAGRIAETIRGTNGFGYDPAFFYPPAGRTAGEMSEEEKNRVSHRFQALSQAKEAVKQYLLKNKIVF